MRWSHYHIPLRSAIADGLPVDYETLAAAIGDPLAVRQELDAEFVDTQSQLLPTEIILRAESTEATLHPAADVQLAWGALEEYDDMLGTVLERRQSALGEIEWDVLIDARAVGEDAALQARAEAQQDYITHRELGRSGQRWPNGGAEVKPHLGGAVTFRLPIPALRFQFRHVGTPCVR